MEILIPQIEAKLKPLTDKGFYTVVETYESFDHKTKIRIAIASSNKEIHNVRGQHPDLISFILSEHLLLSPQSFMGCGGGSLYRNIDPNNPKESWLAMKSEKVPFRKPQQTETAVLKAIERLTDNYIKTLLSFKERGLLRYGDLADYDTLLK